MPRPGLWVPLGVEDEAFRRMDTESVFARNTSQTEVIYFVCRLNTGNWRRSKGHSRYLPVLHVSSVMQMREAPGTHTRKDRHASLEAVVECNLTLLLTSARPQ